MSQFSEKLSNIIKNSGTTIYNIAKNAKLDRTTIQRSISGERLPNINLLGNICDYLRISPSERKELMELFTIEKIGLKLHSRRKYVKLILDQIAALHIHDFRSSKYSKHLNISNDIEQEIMIFYGEYSVNSIILDVLEDEVVNNNQPHINLTVPFDFAFLYNSLYQLYWESKGKIEIEHIIKFNKNPQCELNSNINLEILSKVLPLALCIGNGYQPHYYYTYTDIAQDIVLTMPYYIYTSKRLITISDDFKTAILYNNDDILCLYKEIFIKCLAQTSNLIYQLLDCSNLISSYINANIVFGEVINVIEPQPCFAKYYTHQIIDEHLRQEIPNRDDVKQMIYKYYDSYNNYASNLKCFFSMEGLKYFINTGITIDLPPQFASPFSMAERIYLLKSLRNDILNKDILFRVADPSKLQISSSCTIQTYKDNGIFFCAINTNGIISCKITEQSICDSFNDFFDNLNNSNLIYNKEDTIKIIDEFIEQLEINNKPNQINCVTV